MKTCEFVGWTNIINSQTIFDPCDFLYPKLQFFLSMSIEEKVNFLLQSVSEISLYPERRYDGLSTAVYN